VPVKGVIDGDLCERYTLLPSDKKQMIAGELDRSVREIERKISVSHSPYSQVEIRVLTMSRT
jgi:splicing factor 3B subunit 3